MVLATGTHARNGTSEMAERPLSVLAVTSELPWPLNSGGRLRTFHLLRSLARRFRVRLVAPAVPGQEEAVRALEENGLRVRPAPVPPRAPWREALRATSAAVRREPYVFYRRHDRWPVRRVLREQFRQGAADVLYLDHLDSLVYRKLCPGVPVVLDLHNVYSTLAERTASEQNALLSRLYLRREAALLRKVERHAAEVADALLAVSEEDRAHFEALGARATYLVPNGVDTAAYSALPLGRSEGGPLLLYVGAMTWGPNEAAAHFLARSVLPKVRERVPGARLRVVGRGPSRAVRALNDLPGVEVTGGVPDVLPHLREAHLLAVPLEAGGGTRLKILEAFAAGLPVVSTPVGCEGLNVRHGEHLLIAERERFADEVVAALSAPNVGRRLAARARALAEEQYDWSTVGAVACSAVAAAGAPGPSGNRPALGLAGV